MSTNLTSGIIPFTELFERLMTLARIDSFNNEDYAKGLINDSYTRTLPALEDWTPLIKDTTLAMTARYNTGTVAVTAGGTALTGTSTVWTASMTAANGYKIKMSSNDNIYTFTRLTNTTATISPALSGATDITSDSYVVYRDEYALASDFDRFLKNGSIYVMSGGRTIDTISELPRDMFRDESSCDPADPIQRCLLAGMTSAGLRVVKVNPPPKTAKVYPYEYVPVVSPMAEYTTGTVTATNASATVTGSGTSWSANLVAGMYFRIDATGVGDSSKWYQISSVDSNTQITLTAVYGEATSAGENYTVCSAPTSFPQQFHEFILYDAVSIAVSSQTDPAAQLIIARRGDILTRLKHNFKSRRVNQQFGVEDDGYR
jgi:hypothetical protein